MNKDFEKELELNEGDNNIEDTYEFTEENILLTEEEIKELDIENIEVYIQKTEVLIDEYELSEVIEDDKYNEYLALKKQEKMLYKKIKELKRPQDAKEKGFFDYTRPWMFIYAIILSVIGMFPVNPFLQYALIEKINFLYDFVIVLEGLKEGWGFYFFYIITLLILIVPGYIVWLCLKKDTLEKRRKSFCFLVMQIIVSLMTLLGALIFISFLK